MARRAGGGLPGATQGVQSHTNGDVPPSTIAAKIVDNRSNALPGSKELFSKLLQEYLTDPAVEESSLETNAQLILVVAEAGLDSAQKDDPFSNDIKVEQASSSLAVIRLTIQRVPAVLFYCETTPAQSLKLPLFLTLLPKLISLIGREHLDAIQEELAGLLETCMTAPQNKVSSWQAAESLLQVIDICIHDALSAINGLVEADSAVLQPLEVDLPSLQAISCLVPSMQQSVVVPRGIQAHLTSAWQLSVVAAALMKAAYRARATKMLRQSLDMRRTKSLADFDQLRSSLVELQERNPEAQLERAIGNLQGAFKWLNIGISTDGQDNDTRPFKRRRTGDGPPKLRLSREDQAQSYICKKLGDTHITSLSAVHERAVQRFQSLIASDRKSVLAFLAELPCLEAGLLLEKLLESSSLQRSEELRVGAMLTLQRVVNNSTDVALLDLSKSTLGQWCLRSTHSSSRELRIAAGRALTSFLRPAVPEPVRKNNNIYALNFLKALSDREILSEQETLVMAWSQVGRVCGEEELNIVLVKLVEYLGNGHPLICAVAFDEIARLADAKNCSAEGLFRSFWRTIAVTVVKDLHSRPQKAQQLSELLGMSVGRFLLQTQGETIPYLVLTRSKDILQRVATARNMDIRDICLQPPKHLALILALLLQQNFPDPENAIMSILCDAAPEFQEADLPALIRLEPIPIACEMLKVAGEQHRSKKAPIYQAIKTFVVLAERRPGQGKQPSKTSKLLAQFLDSHILGIMTHFSEIVDAAEEVHSPSEKVRSIRAMHEMFSLAAADFNFSIAIPQIRACLQCALGQPGLSDEALTAWAQLMNSIDEEAVETLVEYTFALIVQFWEHFSPVSQQGCHALIADLIKSYNAVIKDKVFSLPSLASITLLSKYDSEIGKFKEGAPLLKVFEAFGKRCSDENAIVVRRALVELLPYLDANQKFVQDGAMTAQPNGVVTTLVRALMDASVRFQEDDIEISVLCSKCLGLIGCLDPNRLEASKTKQEVMILSNFDRLDETVDFVAFFLEHVLVNAFHSATNARVQNMLAYAMQELLKHCDFKAALQRPRSSQPSAQFQRWLAMSESARSTLIPYFHSRYLIARPADAPERRTYPIFAPSMTHGTWLRNIVHDLLQKAKGENPKVFFPVLSRIIKGHDLSIPVFLLPFTVLNVVLGGTESEISSIEEEMLTILNCDVSKLGSVEAENVRQCSENVFQVLDYLSRWLQQKRKQITELRAAGSRGTANSVDFDEIREVGLVSSVERILSAIPPDILAQRAMECRSFPRALFHWEQYMRAETQKGRLDEGSSDHEDVLHHLQDIYAQIDDPDGAEGISAHLHIFDPDQQIIDYRRDGRWAAAQSWYELQLADDPNDETAQLDLLTCLKESGQPDILLKHVEIRRHTGGMLIDQAWASAAEAAWTTEQWEALKELLHHSPNRIHGDFNIGIGLALLDLEVKDQASLPDTISVIRGNIAHSFSAANTASLNTCHDQMLRLHTLYDLETIAASVGLDESQKEKIVDILDGRLGILGAFTAEKQYLLAIRRAAMTMLNMTFTDTQLAAAWLKSATLARKSNLINVAYNAIHHASKLDAQAAMVEQCRLLWKDGNHKKAIRSLQGAIEDNAFHSYETYFSTTELSMFSEDQQQKHENALLAKAQLLLAKWNDRAGQMSSTALIPLYQSAVRNNPHWDKGHYYLGRYYNKMIESEKSLPSGKQGKQYLCGETSKLVVDNFTRSLGFGAKYYFQTVPKILTLWLDFGQEVYEEQRRGGSVHGPEITELRVKHLDLIQRQLRKYFDRLVPYIFYTAFPQIISRIGHSHKQVYDLMAHLITKIASTYPQQALWSLLAVAKSTARDKASRGQDLLSRLRQDLGKKTRYETPAAQLRTWITQGQRLTESLLHACEASVDSRAVHVSLGRDLHFNHKLAPCGLVVPVEKTMTAVLPTLVGAQNVRQHKPFPNNITIEAFTDDVLVLSSLQRPRKLTVRGSDGQLYGLLCKPKDDLRKDQRLMEFNAMIERSLKRDVEASKRRLYIKTYGVTPLNEECGTIEWVDGLKPMRDIIINNYKQRTGSINYNDIRTLLNEACANLPSSSVVFNDKILPKFPAVLHEWFIEMFPEPEAWHAARLRYARSCAVMSIVGHMLGLGDRHGENVLLEAGSGGVFHVDFNCLFDKGLTFEKPEKVPFRLTHNMVDALGPCGVEGPFRKSAEVTLKVLRQHEDTLMTILETFLYDPTADFLGSGKKKRSVPGVPETPQEVLDSVRGKLRGFILGEKVPLSVEGYVDTLIRMARDPCNLAEMYIGWCAFF